MELHKEMSLLVEDLALLRYELAVLCKRRPEQLLGRPATPAGIARLESQWEVRLPADYRAFLQLHDGWKKFSGDNDLLATDSYRDRDLMAHVTQLKDADPDASSGLVVMGSILTSTLQFFDPNGIALDGGMPLVYWSRGEIVAKYSSFKAMLARWADISRNQIAEERRRLRRPD